MNKGRVHPKVTVHVSPDLKEAMTACGLHPSHCLEVGIMYQLTADRENCMIALETKISELDAIRRKLKNKNYSLT